MEESATVRTNWLRKQLIDQSFEPKASSVTITSTPRARHILIKRPLQPHSFVVGQLSLVPTQVTKRGSCSAILDQI